MLREHRCLMPIPNLSLSPALIREFSDHIIASTGSGSRWVLNRRWSLTQSCAVHNSPSTACRCVVMAASPIPNQANAAAQGCFAVRGVWNRPFATLPHNNVCVCEYSMYTGPRAPKHQSALFEHESVRGRKVPVGFPPRRAVLTQAEPR